MKMYFVTHSGYDGFDCDLFIEANSAEEAFQVWKDYCDEEDWAYDEDDNVYIFETPEKTGEVQVFTWDHATKVTFDIEGNLA